MERRPGFGNKLDVRPKLLQCVLEERPAGVPILIVGADIGPAGNIVPPGKEMRGQDSFLIDRHRGAKDLLDTFLRDQILGQSVGSGMREDTDPVQFGQNGSECQGRAAGVDADEKVGSPVVHLNTRVARRHVRPQLLIQKVQLDRTTQNAPILVDLFNGECRAHPNLTSIVGMGAGQRALPADAHRLLGSSAANPVLAQISGRADRAGAGKKSPPAGFHSFPPLSAPSQRERKRAEFGAAFSNNTITSSNLQGKMTEGGADSAANFSFRYYLRLRTQSRGTSMVTLPAGQPFAQGPGSE